MIESERLLFISFLFFWGALAIENPMAADITYLLIQNPFLLFL